MTISPYLAKLLTTGKCVCIGAGIGLVAPPAYRYAKSAAYTPPKHRPAPKVAHVTRAPRVPVAVASAPPPCIPSLPVVGLTELGTGGAPMSVAIGGLAPGYAPAPLRIGPDIIPGRTVDLPSVPEPITWSLFITGFGLVGSSMRRDQRRVRT